MKPRDLRLLVMHVSTRCDQACAHCSVWKSNGKNPDALGAEDRLQVIREAASLGARSILFTGGEPLLCGHLERLAREARDLGLSVQVATNGLGLSTSAHWIEATVAELYVSLEGPEPLHDLCRGASMFSRLGASIAAFRNVAPHPRLVGRSVISSRNASVLDQTVGAARALGLDAISFLAADTTSDAFGGEPASREFLRPNADGVKAMLDAISRLEAAGELGAFVIEDARKLTWMAADFLAGARPRAPACNAPEWSSVMEADGALRPCFFQPAVSRVGRGVSLSSARRGAAYGQALRTLGGTNAICAACVCPKRVPAGAEALRERIRALVTRAVGAPSAGSGVSA